MMKLSTKGRYGVTAMYDLAMNSVNNMPVSIKNVAERQQISEHYLEQLMGQLRKAGLVKSTRGAQGGYYLTRDPKDITVGDIIRVMEGPIVPVDCLLSTDKNDKHYCEKCEECVTQGIWAKVADSISKVLDGITLEDLCRSEKNAKR